MFLMKQVLKQLILPPAPWFILLVVAGIFWRRRWAKAAFWTAVAIIFVLHSPQVGIMVRYPLETRYAPLIDPKDAEPYDAIVVLMAGTIPVGGLVPFPSVTEPLFRRLDETWRLYRLRPKPIIVSGGHVNPVTTPQNENQIARDYLILWGVPKEQVIAEEHSRDTFESAIEVEKVLREKGWRRYLLVTSAIHMPRSMLAFGSIAPTPVPAPGDFTYVGIDAGVFLTEESAFKIAEVAHEYIGMLNYRWRLHFYKSENGASGRAR
jgi:uncharacterized SAM-binding protein YcdF (DUF218 family)